MARLIPYVRQSRAKERTISLDDQRATIARWADGKAELLAEVVEAGVSGSKDWKTRELGVAIEAVEKGLADGIVVGYQSRLSRESGLGTAEVWDRFDKLGARLVCVGEGVDTEKEGAEFSFGIQAVIARQEWRRHQSNWAKADSHCAENGIVQNGKPVGYDRADGLAWGEAGDVAGKNKNARLTTNADAAHIRTGFEMRVAGKSLAAIGRMLEAAGVLTPTGKTTWGRTSVHSLFSKPVYKGIVGGVLHERLVIVAPDTWAAAQAEDTGVRRGGIPVTLTYDPVKGIIRTKEKRLPRGGSSGGRPDGGRQVLGGIVKCEGCGRTASANPTTNKQGRSYTYFKCPQPRPLCPRPLSIRAETLTEFVLEWMNEGVLGILPDDLDIGDGSDPATVARLTDELGKAQAYHAELEDAVSMGEAVSVAFLTGATRRVADVEAALEAERTKTTKRLTRADVERMLGSGGVEQKRDAVRFLMSEVRVARRVADEPVADRVRFVLNLDDGSTEEVGSDIGWKLDEDAA